MSSTIELSIPSRPSSPRDDCRTQIDRDVDSIQSSIHNFLSGGKIYDSQCSELHKAAIKGDVMKAKYLFGKREHYREMIRCSISDRHQTVLHVAAGAKQTRYIEEMLLYIEPKDLELQDSNGNTAFCFAAMAGAIPIAEKMLVKNPRLLRIRGGANMTPLYLAALFGQRKIASFLYQEHKGSEVEDVQAVFYATICYQLYDLALELLQRDAHLATVYYTGQGTALHMLARNPTAFARGGNSLINHDMDLSTQALELLKCLCNDILHLKGENVGAYLQQHKEVYFDAAKLGNSRFLAELISCYPDLVRELDEEGRTIFHIAVEHRHAAIFNLMNDIGFDKQFIATLPDKDGNNLLHLAAKYSEDQRIVGMAPGPALQMQQELKTFKAVASLVMPSYREKKNNGGLTPRELFTKEHKNLLKNGEEWMKNTAGSSMLIATIIATVVFSATFSVPGDYNENGVPNRLKSKVFSIFSLADATTLSSAAASILIFLSILTSHYKEEDFLTSLPLKLMVGLLTLFISITTMMLSFSLSFFLAYSQDKSYMTIPILICIFVFGPAILFLFLHRGLLKDTFLSLFRSRFSCDPVDY